MPQLCAVHAQLATKCRGPRPRSPRPFLARSALFWGVTPGLGPPRRAVGGQSGAKTRVPGRPPLAQPQSLRPEPEPIFFGGVLLPACLFLLWGAGCSNGLCLI